MITHNIPYNDEIRLIYLNCPNIWIFGAMEIIFKGLTVTGISN